MGSARPMVALEESDVTGAARKAVLAAEEAHKAIDNDPNTSPAVRALVNRVLQESQAVLAVAVSSPRKRQSFAEFTTMLGEEVKEAAEESMQEGIEYAERSLRRAKSIIEDHFHVDEAFRMLGPLRQDSNLARDVHDWFNLVALWPVVVLNLLNWQLDAPSLLGLISGEYSIVMLWHGKAFLTFWWTTMAYFIVDVLFVLLLPQCVKSPGVIVKHHVATLGYIFVPKLRPEYGWLMGALMIVEVNTWFIIARRAFNKRGEKPFTSGVPLAKSMRLCVVSSCFYITWFVIRLGLYPYLLITITRNWVDESKRVGTPINILVVTPVMQCIFIFLNVKWTIDLIRSKLKGRGPGKGL